MEAMYYYAGQTSYYAYLVMVAIIVVTVLGVILMEYWRSR